MDTDMGRQFALNVLSLFVLIAISNDHSAVAKEIEFAITAGSELTYSDNIDLEEKDARSGVVSTWSAGASADMEGNQGKLSFDYDVYQTIHTIDSSRNELFNELAFSANKALYRNNIDLSLNAGITNIARSIEDNANADIITGDTIETRNADIQLSYQSNRRGWVDLYTAVDASTTSNEDDIGDYSSLGANLSFQNGALVQHIFWLTDYEYNQNRSSNTDNRYYDYQLEQEVGLKPIKHVSPLIRVNYEGYTRRDEDKLIESGSWGPAVRYYWHQERSYLEISYDFSFKDEDFWRGALKYNPTSRTRVEFDYTKRFYGDAYDFSLTHRTKKLTNTITYTEELSGFERQFFIQGEDIEEYQLVKELNLSSTLALKRTSLTGELSVSERQTLSDQEQMENSKIHGVGISASHNLSKHTSLSGGFKYDKNVFKSKNKTTHYRRYDISLNNQFSQSLSWDLSLEHANSSSYKENRASVNVDLTY